MKKIVFIMILILLTGCQSTEKLRLSSSIEDATLKSYDIANKQVAIVHSIEKSEVKEIVKAFKDLNITELDSFDGFENDLIYSVEFEPYYEGAFLFSKNIIVTNKGKYFTYDDASLIKSIEEYFENNKYIYELSWFTNQRYISIINGEWFPNYLVESNNGKETTLEISMNLDIDYDSQEVMIGIENNDEIEVDTGMQYHLEVKIDGKWYNIDNVGKNNLIMEFDSVGFTIHPNMIQDFKHDWGHILPLPEGQYRVRQEITYVNKRHFVSQEFMILK